MYFFLNTLYLALFTIFSSISLIHLPIAFFTVHLDFLCKDYRQHLFYTLPQYLPYDRWCLTLSFFFICLIYFASCLFMHGFITSLLALFLCFTCSALAFSFFSFRAFLTTSLFYHQVSFVPVLLDIPFTTFMILTILLLISSHSKSSVSTFAAVSLKVF